VKPKLLLQKNYLAMIENAAKGENWMFRNFYVEEKGVQKDILADGDLSCAVFASSMLYLFNSLLEFSGKNSWIGFAHANCSSTEKDMIKHGWKEIKKPVIGAVLIWEVLNGEPHIGFYIGHEEAVSNSSKNRGFPTKHHYTYNGTRKIEKIYWHPALNKD